MKPLNILHVFRAPVGGLFRHVLDLTREQIARGHCVGLIADLRTGGTRAGGPPPASPPAHTKPPRHPPSPGPSGGAGARGQSCGKE